MLEPIDIILIILMAIGFVVVIAHFVKFVRWLSKFIRAQIENTRPVPGYTLSQSIKAKKIVITKLIYVKEDGWSHEFTNNVELGWHGIDDHTVITKGEMRLIPTEQHRGFLAMAGSGPVKGFQPVHIESAKRAAKKTNHRQGNTPPRSPIPPAPPPPKQ